MKTKDIQIGIEYADRDGRRVRVTAVGTERFAKNSFRGRKVFDKNAIAVVRLSVKTGEPLQHNFGDEREMTSILRPEQIKMHWDEFLPIQQVRQERENALRADKARAMASFDSLVAQVNEKVPGLRLHAGYNFQVQLSSNQLATLLEALK